MIPAHHRLKGGAAHLGATGPARPGLGGAPLADDHKNDEDQDHEPADEAGETRTV
ncbi:hypothetical protein ACH4TM_12490 [Streptomyces parvus]|uniref:hypothetical protein n=1 Tax=Streptomyces parvus TaxID=66428 RepID=UPI0037A3AAA4